METIRPPQPQGKLFFGCAYCNVAFVEMRELEAHTRAMHPGSPPMSKPAPMPANEKGLLTKSPTAAISNSIPLSEVDRHCIPEDCWVAINGMVYDLTEFMDRHPGGPTTILKWAGKDASNFFNQVHKGVKISNYLRPEAYIGSLGVDEQLMTESFWHQLRKARIEEIKQELEKMSAHNDEEEAIDLPHLLSTKALDAALESKLRSLMTQKRVAYDMEDYERASDIQRQFDTLLSEAGKSPPESKSVTGVPLSEVAKHNKPHDCWVAMNGTVYDFTDILIESPDQRKAILAFAGRDASSMWDKIPGRFPSKTWLDFYFRPEFRLFEVCDEPTIDPRRREIKLLREELRRLEGPSEEDIRAAKEARNAVPTKGSSDVPAGSEQSRFPKLKDITAGKTLPFFTRAEVAKHKGPVGGPAGTEPFIIVHNKVYDLKPLLGSHPGGDDILLSRAGTDCTKEFEVFDHSEKSRVRRDQDMLVGEIVPAEAADWAAEAAAAAATTASGVEKGTDGGILGLLMVNKAIDASIIAIAWYAYRAWKHRKPLPKIMYSRGLRHLHLIMAIGIFSTLASATAAAKSEGLAKKRMLAIHKQTGVAMFFALLVRIFFRLRSGIPPRFPGNPLVMKIETMSLNLFYLICMILPVSGMASEYFLKYAPAEDKAADESNDRNAKTAITVHKQVGKFFQWVWMPFHLGYTTAYHYSNGRGVIRKVSPFI